MTSATRHRLPNRRGSETFDFHCNGFHYIATVAFFDDGTLAEIFLCNGKAGSSTDSAAKDSAIVASLGLQFGIPVDVIRHRFSRHCKFAAWLCARYPRGRRLVMRPGINLERGTTRQLELLALRSFELADRVAAGELQFLDAVDVAFDSAVASGLADLVGYDVLQVLLAATFEKVRP